VLAGDEDSPCEDHDDPKGNYRRYRAVGVERFVSGEGVVVLSVGDGVRCDADVAEWARLGYQEEEGGVGECVPTV